MAADETGPKGAEEIPYEQAREELIDVVRRLETGGLTLEESLALWERGEKLATICQTWLDGARARLEVRATEAGEAVGDAGDADGRGD